MRTQSRHVHLVGSVALRDAKEVFTQVSDMLGILAPRLPDGETGDRFNWIGFQEGILNKTPNIRQTGTHVVAESVVPSYGVEVVNAPVKFGSLRYAEEAKASYAIFAALKAAGRIAPTTRFQVSLPTPVPVMFSFVEIASQPQIEAAYRVRLLKEVDEIVAAIPHQELAIQWDVAGEVYMIAGWSGGRYYDRTKERLLRELVPLGNAIPTDVQLGYHICYGDPGHKHVIEPVNLALCVEISNMLSKNIIRPITWIHMPVPRDRADDAYFRPLSELRIASETEFYLGLIHLTDGIEGYRRRANAAKRHRSEFGIATECGMGRRPPESIPELLKLHALAAVDGT